MKTLEYWASIYCKRFTTAWDYYIASSDAYINGYRQARWDAVELAKSYEKFDEEGVEYDLPHCYNGTTRHISKKLKTLGEQDITFETDSGEHQLTIRTFRKWQEQKQKEPFNESLKTQMNWYDFTDLRIEEKDGIISFQGTCKRNE